MKKFSLLFACLVASVLLVGCQNSNSSTDDKGLAVLESVDEGIKITVAKGNGTAVWFNETKSGIEGEVRFPEGTEEISFLYSFTEKDKDYEFVFFDNDGEKSRESGTAKGGNGSPFTNAAKNMTYTPFYNSGDEKPVQTKITTSATVVNDFFVNPSITKNPYIHVNVYFNKGSNSKWGGYTNVSFTGGKKGRYQTKNSGEGSWYSYCDDIFEKLSSEKIPLLLSDGINLSDFDKFYVQGWLDFTLNSNPNVSIRCVADSSDKISIQ